MTFLSVKEGNLFYEARPAQEGHPTLLFFPGLGSDGTNYQFRQVIMALPPEVGYIALDTIGCGQSEGTMNRTVSAILANYQAVVAHEKPEQLVLLGHSMGGFYAAKYALLEPRVRRLLLIEPTHSGLGGYLVEVLEEIQNDYRKAEVARARGQLAASDFASTVNPLNERAVRLENQTLVARTFGNVAQQSELANHQEILAEMEKVETASWTLPVTVVVVDERVAEYRTSHYAQFAKIIGLPGEHYLQWTTIDQINQLVRSDLLTD